MYDAPMPTEEIRQARAKMQTAQAALKDFNSAEPYNADLARLLLRDLLNATEEYVLAVETRLKPAPEKKPRAAKPKVLTIPTQGARRG
jgi:hypothetical protein